MNEFTKEELQEIRRCLKYMINGGVTPYSCKTLELKKKLQSLIDNYCEHIWTDGSGNHIYCGLCQAYGGKR